jgi:HEAT repeat protein
VLLFVLCGGCGGFGYYLFVYLPKKARETQEQWLADLDKQNNKWPPVDNNPPNPFNPGPGPGPGPGPIINPPQKRAGDYANLDEALEDAKPGDNFRATEACKWIARQKADDARRMNVINRLEPLLAEVFIRDEAARAIGIWASKDQVPTLITMLDNDSGGVKKVGFDTLAKLKDDRAAEPLAKKLPNFFERKNAANALVAFGPTAEKEVAKYAFDPDNGVQTEARKILKGYKAKDAVLINQAITELNDGDNGHKQQAAAWLEKASLDAASQDAVAKALEPLLVDNDRNLRDPALKALKYWATKDNTPALVRLLDHQDGNVRKSAMEVLGKLKDERAVLPIALRLIDFFDRQTASNTLKGMGPIVEIPDVVNGLRNKDAAIRLEVCRILGAAGTSKSVTELERVARTDKNKEVASAAAAALKTIEDREKGGK